MADQPMSQADETALFTILRGLQGLNADPRQMPMLRQPTDASVPPARRPETEAQVLDRATAEAGAAFSNGANAAINQTPRSLMFDPSMLDMNRMPNYAPGGENTWLNGPQFQQTRRGPARRT